MVNRWFSVLGLCLICLYKASLPPDSEPTGISLTSDLMVNRWFSVLGLCLICLYKASLPPDSEPTGISLTSDLHLSIEHLIRYSHIAL